MHLHWTLRRICILAAVAGAGASIAALASAASSPMTATRIRLGDHPAYVRAVADFTPAILSSHQVSYSARQIAGVRFAIDVSGSHLSSGARSVHGLGATVSIVRTPRGLRIEVRAGSLRFKYASFAVVMHNRLAIDLWKGAPPPKAAEMRTGAGGCLTLDRWKVTAGRVTAAGREHNIFEHQFATVVRASNGRVLVQRHVSATGHWSSRMAYRSTKAQAGTLEAVDFGGGAGDICLAQVRIWLPRAP